MDSSEDAETFQAWLRWRQFPADCRGTAGRVVWAGLRPGQGGKAGEEYPRQYFYALGLGSQMVALKMSFLSALLSPGRVLHWPTSHYINPLRCPSRSFGCYFAPITNCTLPPDLRNNRSGTPAAPAEPAGAVEDGRRLNRRSLRQRQGREREEDSIPEVRDASKTRSGLDLTHPSSTPLVQVCSPRGPGASRGRGWPASSFCRMRPASGAEHGSLEFEKVLWCTDTPRRRLSRLAGLRRVHSMAWYHAQISAFLFRPNAELRAFRAAVAPTLERRGNASRWPGGTAPRDPSKISRDQPRCRRAAPLLRAAGRLARA